MSREALEWTDIIVVMENEQRIELSQRFPKQYMKKRIVTLGISDVYRYRQPELIEQLKMKRGKINIAILLAVFLLLVLC